MSYTGWHYYGNNIGIQSPDGTQSVLLTDDEVQAWILSGGVPLPVPALSVAEVKIMLEDKVQEYLDQKAQAKGYRHADSCVGYLNSTNSTWKADAVAFNSWRDSVWTYCFNNQASATPSTTWPQLLALLPAAPW